MRVLPIDQDTVGYLKATGRGKACADLVEQYAKAQGMYRTKRSPDPVFTSTLSLDLGDVRPSPAQNPQDRVLLDDMAAGSTLCLMNRALARG